MRWLNGAPWRALKIALAGLIALQTVATLATPAAAAAGTVLLADDFLNGTVTAGQYVVGGSGFTPCLTASGTGASTPGRCTPTTDTPGNGALRLTSAANNQSGF